MLGRPAGREKDRSNRNVPSGTASANVLINGQRALRVGDRGPPKTWNALEGAPTVLINGWRAHRCGDAHENGELAQGSPDVLVGNHVVQEGQPLLLSVAWDETRAHTGIPVGITVATADADGQAVLVEVLLDNHPEGRCVVDGFLLMVSQGFAECTWACDLDWSDNPDAVELPDGGFPRFRVRARLGRQVADGGLLELRQDLLLRHGIVPPEGVSGRSLHVRLADSAIVTAAFDDQGVVHFRDLVPGPCKLMVPHVPG